MPRHSPGHASNPLIEWPVPKITVTRTRRTSALWSVDSGLVPKYQNHLAGLGLIDPTAASEYWTRAQSLVDQSRAIRVAEPRSNVAARLAEGEIDSREAQKLESKRPDRESPHELKRTLEAASRTALLRALQAIHEHDWHGELKPIASDALARGDGHTLNRTHRFAAWLREPVRVKVFGLAAAKGADPSMYQFRRPDLVYRWRVDHVDQRHLRELTRYPDEGAWHVAYVFHPDALFPTIRDYDDAWGPGLYSAEEVVENIKRCREEQEKDFAQLVGPPPPAPEKRHRVVMSG